MQLATTILIYYAQYRTEKKSWEQLLMLRLFSSWSFSSFKPKAKQFDLSFR